MDHCLQSVKIFFLRREIELREHNRQVTFYSDCISDEDQSFAQTIRELKLKGTSLFPFLIPPKQP
jgi:hypothetical protein